MEDRIRLLREEVKKGNIAAAFRLAEAYKWGYYGDVDPHRAARMYRICCRSKDKVLSAEGYYNLGILWYFGHLSDGEVGPRETKMAFQCFLKSVLSHPTPEAFTKLGDMYRYGQHVEKNERIAMGLYRKANA